MPARKSQLAEKVNARAFRRLSEYMTKSSSTLTHAISDDALANLTGVKNRGPKGSYLPSDQLTNREQKRVEQIRNLNPLQKLALIGQASLYGGLHKELNKHLKDRNKLPPDRIRKDSTLVKTAGGSALQGNAYEITVQYSSAKRVSYSRFPHTIEYRDPARAKSGDKFHWGASSKFKRYGITSVNIFGSNKSAGRKGTEIEGIGWEPIGYRPKSSADKGKYRVFKRVGYPGRATPDRVTRQHRFPIYSEFLKDKALSKPVYDRVRKDADSFARAWAKRHGEVITDLVKKINKT